MNHYDDLQRFQEKTRTQNLNFQDLSSQAATREHGDWAILNQLNPAAENYAHLFAAKSAEPVAKNKDQPLKSLLERIATCR